MGKPPLDGLSWRERQVMDIIYRQGEVSAAELETLMPEQLSNSTLRTMLRKLEAKGHLRHREKNLKYVYSPAHKVEKVKRLALDHLITTFFNGSPSRVVAAILDPADTQLSDEERTRIRNLIERAKKGKA